MPATKPRDYLFALTDGGGTVPPELGVVRRLVEEQTWTGAREPQESGHG